MNLNEIRQTFFSTNNVHLGNELFLLLLILEFSESSNENVRIIINSLRWLESGEIPSDDLLNLFLFLFVFSLEVLNPSLHTVIFLYVCFFLHNSSFLFATENTTLDATCVLWWNAFKSLLTNRLHFLFVRLFLCKCLKIRFWTLEFISSAIIIRVKAVLYKAHHRGFIFKIHRNYCKRTDANSVSKLVQVCLFFGF